MVAGGVTGQRREHQAVRLADGRLLGFAEYGDAAGDPILFFHGEVGSRLLGRAFDPAARRVGLRVVAPDRPGLGFSDFRPGRRIADWADDVAGLASLLDIDRFAVVGAAGGAPYVLACASTLGARLTAALVAGAVLAVPRTTPARQSCRGCCGSRRYGCPGRSGR